MNDRRHNGDTLAQRYALVCGEARHNRKSRKFPAGSLPLFVPVRGYPPCQSRSEKSIRACVRSFAIVRTVGDTLAIRSGGAR